MRLVLLPVLAFSGALSLAASSEAAVWSVPGDFATIQDALDSSTVASGDTLQVAAGDRAGATVTKRVTLEAQGLVVIVSGPAVGPGEAGFLFPGGGAGSGSTIENFRFDVDFPVFSRGADDVSVIGNTLDLPIQGVTDWGNGGWGSGWLISRNTILGLLTSCGGGIGILVGDYNGGTIRSNLVTENMIRGQVWVPPGDCGGYNAPGILLYADFRGGAPGASEITANRITGNRVGIRTSDPALVTVSAVELSDTRDLAGTLIVDTNAVHYNDLRGMVVPVSYTPDELSTVNDVSDNQTGTGGILRAGRPLAPALHGSVPAAPPTVQRFDPAPIR
jgi:hypothetical protein